MVEATPIELKMIAYRKSAKDGIVVSFAIHPQDIHDNLAAAAIGTRFMAALVEIGDDEKPVVKNEPNRLVQRAGILCSDQLFKNFLRTNFPMEWNKSDGDPTITLRGLCNIKSRSELATSEVAAGVFEMILGKYEAWRRGME